jgi:hypothetical protein
MPALATALLGLAGCAVDPPKPLAPPSDSEPSGGAGSEDLDAVDFDIRPDTIWNPAISPLIYGYNGARRDTSQLAARLGGNRLTAFNWETGASNAGKDFKYQNDAYLSATDVPGDAVKSLVQAMTDVGGTAVLTVPIVDWVSADKNADGDVRASASGSDYLEKRFVHNHPARTDGKALQNPPDPSDREVYQAEFVSFLKATYPSTPMVFDLDNEPDLWSETHPEAHPEKVGYDELVQRNTDYAAAIKTVSPLSEVAGFVSYGWNGFTNLQAAPDRGSRGDFTEFYLDKMQAASKSAGHRLIDYLDLHWYPEATGGGSRIVFSGKDETTEAQVKARVQAPRSLWDFSYKESSYISQSVGPIVLIPRMKQKIAQHDPGTKLAFTEWSYGGVDHISGAIATADVIGIFAREGVGLSTIWATGKELFNSAAVRVYRNFDGAGAHFGDQYVWAKTNSVYASSVHAAVEGTNKQRLVIVAINKRPAVTTASIHIKGASATYAGASVFVLQGATATIKAMDPVAATSANEIAFPMPPLSISVLVPYVGEAPPIPEPAGVGGHSGPGGQGGTAGQGGAGGQGGTAGQGGAGGSS